MNIKIRNVFINLLLAIILGTLLLVLVFIIPTDSIDNHVKESAYTLAHEGSYPSVFDSSLSNLDNFTDSLMLLEATNKNDKPLLVKALGVYRIDYKDESIGPYNTLIKHYIDNEEAEIQTSYERYWHGYLITLKPLLLIFNYSQIRILNLILESLLTMFVLFFMYKQGLKVYIIPYLISYLLLNPYVISLSLQYSTIFYIFTISSLTILVLNNDFLIKYNYLIILNIGIITAYFDYLTYPIVSLGIPLLIYLVKVKDYKLINILKLILYWAIGYFVMWGSKWIIADIFTNENVLKGTINQILIRSNNSIDGKTYTLFDCLYSNYIKFIATPVKYVLFVYILIYIILVFKNKIKVNTNILLIFILITLLPVIWYSFTINHSLSNDYLFTNKTALISFSSIMFYLANINN